MEGFIKTIGRTHPLVVSIRTLCWERKCDIYVAVSKFCVLPDAKKFARSHNSQP